MSRSSKILRFLALLSGIVLLSGTLLAQNPLPNRHRPRRAASDNTANLESQPNTNQYPGQIVPNQPPTEDPEQKFPPAPAYRPPAPRPVANPAPPVTNPPAQVAQPPQTTAIQNPQPQALPPQNQGTIGPPAPIPPTLEQMPPVAPKISYQNGLLTVESTNARLSDILNAVRSKTGIQFEGMQASNDRVAGKFGPSPVEEVLVNLLRGSRFDYVIVGLPDNPEAVQRVILTPTTGGPAAPSAPVANAPRQPTDADEDDNSDEGTTAEAPQGNQVQPIQPQQLQQPNGPKTAEQLAQEMKMIQQQQQQQQNQNQPVAPPAPIKRRPLNPQ